MTTARRAPSAARRPNGTGKIRQLPSGRWQASFRGPDGVLRPAPETFSTKLNADGWLKRQMVDVDRDRWVRPTPTTRHSGLTLREYADSWLAARELKPRTRIEYRRLLDSLILPDLGHERLDRITPATVRTWYGQLDATKPTRRSHAYQVLRTIFTTAVADDLIATANPCRIRGAGSTGKPKHKTQVATLAELDVIADTIAQRYRLMVLLAAWCGLRFGELAELRRGDIDVKGRVVRVSRGVTRAAGEVFIGNPKSDAGERAVAIPPHLMSDVRAHLKQHVGIEPGALLFPARQGSNMNASAFYRVWRPAAAAAGRPDLRPHELRHTGATMAAATGATLADLMSRLGHSTPQAAMRYQHAASDRDALIASALSGFAKGKVVPLRGAARGKRTQIHS
jgi:integrase